MQFSPLLKNTLLRPWNIEKHTSSVRNEADVCWWGWGQGWTNVSNGSFHVTIVKDDERRLSSQLQPHFLEVARPASDTQTQAHQITQRSRPTGSHVTVTSPTYVLMIVLPTGVDPVKPSLRMSGCSAICCPTTEPESNTHNHATTVPSTYKEYRYKVTRV